MEEAIIILWDCPSLVRMLFMLFQTGGIGAEGVDGNVSMIECRMWVGGGLTYLGTLKRLVFACITGG